MKKSLVLVSSSALVLALAPNFAPRAVKTMASGQASSSSLFSEEGGLRAKTGVSSGEDSQKGLLLYGYDAGATSSFHPVQEGVFEADMLLPSDALSSYSIHFSSSQGQEFAFHIDAGETYSYASVIYGEEKAGIHYYQTSWNLIDTPYGYTTGYNANGEYTRFKGKRAKIYFDPSSLQAKIKNDAGSYELVWDFKKEFNDGKRLKNDLTSFNRYTVSLSFDSLASNKKGELLVYSFGGYSFASEMVSSAPKISVSASTKAVVGQVYSTPTPTLISPLKGLLSADAVGVSIYDEEGNLLNEDGAKSFTPAEVGNYYLYYSYQNEAEGEKADAMIRVQAIEESDLAYSFSYESSLETNLTLGTEASLSLPAATVSSSLIASGESLPAKIEVKQGENVLASSNDAGLTYVFATAGSYEIVYSCPSLGQSVKESHFVTVSDDIPTFLAPEVEKEYVKGASFDVPDAALIYQGKKETMGGVLHFPSGRSASGKGAVLNELGLYRLTYDGKDGKVYDETFLVSVPQATLFSGTSASFATLSQNDGIQGVELSLKSGETAVFSKKINLAEHPFHDYGDPDLNKKNNVPFLEAYADPKTLGATDMSGLYVVLTDAKKPSNTVTMRLKHQSYADRALLRTKASGQIWVGYNYSFWDCSRSVHAEQRHEDGGFGTGFAFSYADANSDIQDNGARLYWNQDEASLYAQPAQFYGHTYYGEDRSHVVPWLVRDFDTTDDTLSAGDAPWAGFSSDEAILSLYATGVNGAAKVLVSSVNGESLASENVEDEKGPSIAIDKPEVTPTAQVGVPYAIFPFSAEDNFSRVVEKTVRVTHNGQDFYAGSSFVPEEEGEYDIVYSAKDSFGNVSTKTVQVEAKAEVPFPGIELQGDLPASVKLGETVELPKIAAAGGAGGLSTEISVETNGKSIPVSGNKFLASELGDYHLTFKAIDYLGHVSSVQKTIADVQRSSTPIFDETSLALPDSFLDGDAFLFPSYQADYYDASLAKTAVQPTIKVSDAKGETTVGDDLRYVPSRSDEVPSATITITFQAASGDPLVITRNVAIAAKKTGTGFMGSYFAGNADVNPTQTGIDLSAKEGESGAGASFLRPISDESLSFVFAFQGSGLKIHLHDRLNQKESVTLSLSGSSAYRLSDAKGNSGRFNSSTDGDFTFAYHKDDFGIYDVLGAEAIGLSTYDDGTPFAGFSSGSVWLSFTWDSGTISFKSLASQTFNTFRRDANPPRILLSGDCSGSYSLGTAIKLPSAKAYDVLGEVVSLTSYVAKDGIGITDAVPCEEERTYTPSDYGTYSVVYSARDASGNIATVSLYFRIVDTVAPSLKFASSLPEEVSVGQTLTLPSYIVQDNGDVSAATVHISYVDPNGLTHTVSDGTITFSLKGVYWISYFVMDDQGNVNHVTFRVEAK